MRDVEEGDANLRLQTLQFDLHVLAQLGVEGGHGFIEQQQGGLIHEGARERDALLLTTGELRRTALTTTREVDEIQHLAGAATRFFLRDFLAT